jgi:hypothetical protein
MRLSIGIAVVAVALCVAVAAEAHSVPVRDTGELADAIAHAAPGDDIVLADGRYLITRKLAARASGTAQAPITVRAAHRWAAHIETSWVIAFEVTGAYWHFADLSIRGVCADDTTCEHAFHVVGEADGFQLTHSAIIDFNAHVKVNADAARHMPAGGVIANNRFVDTHPRHTGNPVAPINIDDAVAWVVRANVVAGFQKDGAGEGAYGIFVKGGSQSPIVERNVVMCGHRARVSGEVVGLSFGAHGMDAALCPPHWDAAIPCDPEVTGGIMRNNVVENCSGDGIYLNKARDSKILFNTLIRTGGITFRYPASTGVARGNLMDAAIRSRDGGSFTDGGNAISARSVQDFDDWFKPGPVRLRTLPADTLVTEDFCGRKRLGVSDVGAFQRALGPDCPLVP